MIVEGFIDFDYEITLLTVRHAGGTTFCEPIGHLQRDGDYARAGSRSRCRRARWRWRKAIARQVTDELGGWGVFGVELFVKGDEVWFSRGLAASARHRPGDAGVAGPQRVRAACARDPRPADPRGPSGAIRQRGAAASCAVLAEGHGVPVFEGVDEALRVPDTTLRLFGKPRVEGHRRVGVTLALGDGVDEARVHAREAAAALTIELR